jgi:transmembrane sensor
VPEAPRPAVVAEVAPVEIKERLAWRIPRLEFDGVELARAVELLNRDNRLQISLDGAPLRSLHISGTFLSDDPRTFARLAAASLGLEVADRGPDEIVLRKPAPPPRPR